MSLLASALRRSARRLAGRKAPFSSTAAAPQGLHLPVTNLTEDEEMLRDMVSTFAANEIAPLVAEMDETSTMNPQLIDSLFANGLMGVEVPAEHGGSGVLHGHVLRHRGNR